MPQETSNPRYTAPRTRRTYTAQFKVQLIAACLQPDASIAALAREHGMNANVLHRWRKEHRAGMHQCDVGSFSGTEQSAQHTPSTTPPPLGSPACAMRDVDVARTAPAFVALDLRQSSVQAPPASELTSALADIRIECCHDGTQVKVYWPMAATAQCASWLHSLVGALLRGGSP